MDERLLVEVGELLQQRAKFLAHDAHHIQKSLQVRISIVEAFLVRNNWGDLRRQQKARRDFVFPSRHDGRRRRVVIRGVNFYRVELRGVVGQEIARLHFGWIECAFPTRRAECRCPESNGHHRFARFRIKSASSRLLRCS
jgi:hypothetical protein